MSPLHLTRKQRLAGLLGMFLVTSALAPVIPATHSLAGVTMPDTIRVDGATLRLNGMGVRSFTFLQIHGYVAGLYVPAPAHDEATLLATKGPKLLQISYVRSAGLGRVRGEMRAAHLRTCASGCSPREDGEYQQLLATARPVHAGDVSSYVFQANGDVQVLLDDQRLATIHGPDLARAMLDGMIGRNAPTRALRTGLLGG
ncbi:chalcone isomerase family protein [Lichenicoccus sp.]|uniref:chalcone isomerase family protein n=1 Tax=Lichenicoccus sp. TaxID=2781899 RepID=UPI003D0C24F7